MSPYEFATIVLTILLAAVGWWNKVIWTRMDNFQKKFDSLPDTYARRDDVKDIESKILDAISDLSKKIDTVILGGKHGS